MTNSEQVVHPAVPIDVQIAAVRREIRMRETVYPRRVEALKMKQEAADAELAAMKAVEETLLAVKKQLMPELF